MKENYDIIIIGSGPAGVSAAFPLVEGGLKVLMLDAGTESDYNPIFPEGNFLDLDSSKLMNAQQKPHSDQAKIFNNISPKLKIPGIQSILENFQNMNHIILDDFVAVGALATGGLSNIWGAGIAFYDNDDLHDWPISYSDLASSYAEITKRIGISGCTKSTPEDVSALIQPPVKLDSNHQYLLSNFYKKTFESFDLWQAQNAIITKEKDSRLSCNSSGLCLWGCSRHSIWNAKMDLDKLKKYPNFIYVSGVFVKKLERNNDLWTCLSRNKENGLFAAKTIILAAGTIGSTRIVFSTLKAYNTTVRFQSNPSAAFMLWMPRRLRSGLENAYAMAQLSFSFNKEKDIHGNLFSAAMIPRSEYFSASAIPAKILNPVLSMILSSSVIGNCFFKGGLSDHSMRLLDNHSISIQGRYNANANEVFKRTRKSLIKHFLKLGALMIPSSFRMSEKGADIHYACTLPMKTNPSELQTDKNGQLSGHDGLYIVDGSVFTTLPAKPLTLTIMANAHRIASIIANQQR